MERFADEAVVLSTIDYGEADRLVTLLTRSRGKLTAFAAGARKSRRRFAGALEPCTQLRAQLVERRGSTLRLDAVDVLCSFHGLRSELPLIARALYCAELCRELVRDGEPHASLYGLMVDYLGELEQRRAGPTSLLLFELTALSEVGLQPRFDRCALCGGEVGASPRFDPEHGGAVCESCGPRSRFGVPVSGELVRALAGLQGGAREPLSAELRQRGRALLNLFIAHQLGRKLRSVEFLTQVGVE